MKKILFFSLAFLFVLAPALVSAHLDAGEDKVIGKYLVDFGYAPDAPKVGDHVDLSFNLLDHKTEAVIVPDHVWVRVAQGDNVVFSGTFFPQNKNVIFSQTFFQAGNYDVTTRFFDRHNQMIVESVTNLPIAAVVTAPESNSYPLFNSVGQIYLLLGALVVMAVTGYSVGKQS